MAKEVCRHFKGDRPCKYYWVDMSHECGVCVHLSPVKERILLIRLDAFGGVLRTTPLVTGLKRRYPDSCITWLVESQFSDLLKDNAEIDKVMKYDIKAISALEVQEFDILINLDKSQHAAALAMKVAAKEKRGYGLDEKGIAFPFNDDARYHYGICLDNWGKKTECKKTYQELIFGIAGLEYRGEEYVFNLSKEKADLSAVFMEKYGIKSSDKVIGLNPGCGPLYPHKSWSLKNYAELVEMLSKEYDVKFLLLGGPLEVKSNPILVEMVKDKVRIIDATNSTSMADLSSLINLCEVLVTSDTAAMHLAISLKKQVVALFGPTPANEIDMYGRGIKLVAKVGCINCYDQFPCNRKPSCVDTITPEEVFAAVKDLIDKRACT